MKQIQIRDEEEMAYKGDVERIQKILQEHDYDASLYECQILWDKYSDSMAASWMILPEKDEEVFGCIEYYILN